MIMTYFLTHKGVSTAPVLTIIPDAIDLDDAIAQLWEMVGPCSVVGIEVENV